MQLRIKELLKEKGLLHKELAEKLGVSDIALRASLKGNPTIGTLKKVANALNVPVSELFDTPKQGVITCPHCGKDITIKAEE